MRRPTPCDRDGTSYGRDAGGNPIGLSAGDAYSRHSNQSRSESASETRNVGICYRMCVGTISSSCFWVAVGTAGFARGVSGSAQPDAGVIRIAYRVALGAEDSPLDWWRYATWQLGSDLLVAPLAERWIDQRFEAQPEVHKRGGRVLLSWADEYRDFLEALPLTHLFNAELDREVATVLRGESLETVRLEAEASGARLQRLASELASVQFPPVPAPFSQVRSILSAVQRSEALES